MDGNLSEMLEHYSREFAALQDIISENNNVLRGLNSQNNAAQRELFELCNRNEGLEMRLESLKGERAMRDNLDELHRMEMLKIDTIDAKRRTEANIAACDESIARWANKVALL